ncbi:MAG: hypothetical protein Q8R98_14380 [Rubrivivax sp.]|nr:hypothetical protein [Rubrivivax sp.]
MADNDGNSDEARVLRPLQAAACTHRITFGPLAGQQVLTVQGAMPRENDFWPLDRERRGQPSSACTDRCSAQIGQAPDHDHRLAEVGHHDQVGFVDRGIGEAARAHQHAADVHQARGDEAISRQMAVHVLTPVTCPLNGGTKAGRWRPDYRVIQRRVP